MFKNLSPELLDNVPEPYTFKLLAIYELVYPNPLQALVERGLRGGSTLVWGGVDSGRLVTNSSKGCLRDSFPKVFPHDTEPCIGRFVRGYRMPGQYDCSWQRQTEPQTNSEPKTQNPTWTANPRPIVPSKKSIHPSLAVRPQAEKAALCPARQTAVDDEDLDCGGTQTLKP